MCLASGIGPEERMFLGGEMMLLHGPTDTLQPLTL